MKKVKKHVLWIFVLSPWINVWAAKSFFRWTKLIDHEEISSKTSSECFSDSYSPLEFQFYKTTVLITFLIFFEIYVFHQFYYFFMIFVYFSAVFFYFHDYFATRSKYFSCFGVFAWWRLCSARSSPPSFTAGMWQAMNRMPRYDSFISPI